MTVDHGAAGRCSIIVPTHNRRRLLRRTLATLMAQTHGDFEIIVSDDGSTDGTADEVTAMPDSRVHLVRSPECQGVAAARGEWLAFCDDDDLWVPGKLDRQIARMRATGRQWSYGGAVFVDDHLNVLRLSGIPVPETLARRLAHGNAIPGSCSSVVASRRCIEAAGGFDPQLSLLADWDLWLRLFQTVGEPAAVHHYLILYATHEAQMIRGLTSLRSEIRCFRLKHKAARVELGTPPIDSFDVWAIHALRSGGRRREAVTYALHGAASHSPAAVVWLLWAMLGERSQRSLAAAPPAERAAARLAVAQVRAVLAAAE
jgi:glycosyltransferase involved in cell wall biosynthesis